MAWWGWLILGMLLAGAELFADTAFYLLFAGLAAFAVGLLGLAGVALPVWAQWIAFTALMVASLLLFRRRLYHRVHGGAPRLGHAALGAPVTVGAELPSGGRTRVRLQGTDWAAVNAGASAIPSGGGARVVGIEGVELRIEGAAPGSPATSSGAPPE